MILLAFRHGLRASEVCDLRWDQVDFPGAVLHVRRVKNGTPSTHPIQGDELRALRRLQRESPSSPFVFVSKRGSPGDPGMAGPSVDHQHRGLHSAGAEPVQRLLVGLAFVHVRAGRDDYGFRFGRQGTNCFSNASRV
jgi:integrase